MVAQLDLHLRGSTEPLLHRAIMSATALYAAFLVIPFMPAIEIGFSMLMIFGGRIAPLVYFATVAALAAAFLLGRLVPATIAARAFDALGFTRAGALAAALAPLSRRERVAWLTHRFPLLRHRHLALILLLNLPGNIVLGGGGGIALVAGMTRLYAFPAYLLTVAVAVAPVPLAVRLAGG